MTAYDNVAFPLSLQGVDEEEIDKKVREISKLLDMDYMLNELADSLGGGERQRVGIARALIRKSNVLLMDEPISHLDAALRAKTRTELVRLQKVLGITTVYVTHDQLEALAMADRIAVLNFGELQQFGTADELYYAPENKFVADFVGEPPMNFIPCKLQRKGRDVRLFTENLGFDITLKGEDASRVDPNFKDGSVWFGVRPKDTKVVPSSENDYSGRNLVKSEVLNFEPGCEHSIIEAKICEYRNLIQCDPGVSFKSNDKMYLDVTSKRFHLFDFQTEKSILAKKL
jgi:multiple sugar transport system ATP-binding protein